MSASNDKAPSLREPRSAAASVTGRELGTTVSASGQAATSSVAVVDELSQFGAANPALLGLLRQLRLLAREGEGTYVSLQRGQVLFDRNEICHHAYFPLTARLAYECVLDNGRAIELASAAEGSFAGWPLLTGGDSMPFRTTVVVAGTAYCCTASGLRACLVAQPALETLMLDCLRGFFAELFQRAACIKLHTVDQQVACRLLTLDDQRTDALPAISVASIARALGVTDRSVRSVLRQLAKDSIVTLHRGVISTLDRAGLETRSCECYRMQRAFYRPSGER